VLRASGAPVMIGVASSGMGDVATNGQGISAFGAAWFAVSPAGNQVTGRSTAAPSNGY